MAPAGANHSITTLVSTGPDSSNGSGTCCGTIISSDGSRAIFESGDRLVGADTEDGRDVYERSGGTTTLISTGPSGGEDGNSQLEAISADGSRVIFSTTERLTGADEDDTGDLYERVGNTTTLLSTGPDGGNGNFDVRFGGASADATHVVFNTDERLVAADTDSVPDIYERAGGTTTLVSTGPTDDGNATAQYPGIINGCCDPPPTQPISRDGTHVFFYTQERFVAADTDSAWDIYERSGGTTKLVSTGPTDTGVGIGETATSMDFDMSDDGTRVIFASSERLVAADLDSQLDIYERSNGTTTTLVSTGPGDTNSLPVCVYDFDQSGCRNRISADGSHNFFYTYESLSPQDTDGNLDLYDRSGGTVQLVSIGPAGGNGAVDVDLWPGIAMSSDGNHVFFSTGEALTSDDTNIYSDIYERTAGTTALISMGGSVYLDPVASDDGSRLIVQAFARLVPADTDNRYDVYERYAGTTTLISTGPGDTNSYDAQLAGISADAREAFFYTNEPLVGTDTVPLSQDLYERSVAAGASSAGTPAEAPLPGYKEMLGAGGTDVLP